ncbi:related to Beta-mannosidase precursor [Pseudozyma flocculosa]|uniref:Beta-mannosidase A n=1 Tax=Pseudozyma flocculosa TaxID=84751 RepID=A0A5C3F1N4_9BASI|nr:related to Beta-mannosidase precursor [Pseudozyma flocculosa]
MAASPPSTAAQGATTLALSLLALVIWSIASLDTSHVGGSNDDHIYDQNYQQSDGKATSDDAVQISWTLKNHNGSITVPAFFPSLVHLDLIRAGIIQQPSVGLNEGIYRWIIDEPAWTYTADLSSLVARHAHHYDHFHLYFQGLDTVADVYLGDQHVGSTHNQHRSHVFDVTECVHALSDHITSPHRNLTIRFSNPNAYAAGKARAGRHYSDQREAPTTSRSSRYQYPNRMFIRKQQSDFGWDWGPALVPCGPHQPAYLIGLGRRAEVHGAQPAALPVAKRHASDDFFVQRHSFDIYRKGQRNNLAPDQDANWIVNVTLSILSSWHADVPKIRLAIPELDLYTFDVLLSSPVRPGLNEGLHATFELPSSGHYAPALWWPVGHGEAKLYDALIRSDELGIELSTRVGFRTAVLSQAAVTAQEVRDGAQPGSRFQVEINGVAIYVQGTNVVPFDTLGPRTSPRYVRWLLESVLAAHQNLIRIWGGGSYSSAELLSLCDELGLLVWTDAMFAASLYPADATFLADVEAEVAEAVPLLSSHPCVVALVGNNEGELYFLGGYGHRDDDAALQVEYDRLFNVVVRDAVLSRSRSLSYIPCSTTTGYLALYPDYVPRYTRGVGGELYGTGENYNYDMRQSFNVSTYPRSRFVVEFGMMSMPSIYTWDRVLVDLHEGDGDGRGDRGERYEFNGTQVQNHNKHMPAGSLEYPWNATEGQGEMTWGVQTNFPVPLPRRRRRRNGAEMDAHEDEVGAKRELLAQWSYTTQCFQALYVGAQILYYRLGATRAERNRGLVVWQLNDVWEGSSWSSIEYGGRWKVSPARPGPAQPASCPCSKNMVD